MTTSRKAAAALPAVAPPATTTPARPAADPTPGIIRDGEVYRLQELARRLHWGEHSLRQAKRAGLQFIRFGRDVFIRGRDVLALFDRLADQQVATAEEKEDSP